MDREKVIYWLTEISLRPCDFTRDDFDAYETERLANDSLALLKELDPVEPELEGGGSTWWNVCGECHGAIDISDNFCKHCGRRIKHEKKAE